jgi:hypothetical protein
MVWPMKSSRKLRFLRRTAQEEINGRL